MYAAFPSRQAQPSNEGVLLTWPLAGVYLTTSHYPGAEELSVPEVPVTHPFSDTTRA